MDLKQLKKKIENIDPNISVLINSDTNQPIEVFAIGYPDLDSKITPLSGGSIYTFLKNEWNFENAYENLNPNQMDKLQSVINDYRKQYEDES